MDRNYIHWVDLNKPQETHFRSLTSEGTDTPTFKYVQGNTEPMSTKAQILAITLYDAVMKYRTNLVKEQNEEEQSQDFFSTMSWQDFKQHGRMMASFLNLKDKDVDEALRKLEDNLRQLAPDGQVEKGFENIQQLEKILQDSGIADNGNGGKGVIPEIKMRHFLDLLSPEYKVKVGSKTQSRTKEGEYDIKLFIQLILDRDKRKFASYIHMSGITPGKILDQTFKKGGEKSRDIFRKIVSAGNYQKNGAAVGKAEIALALFFGDCSLPNKKGDIELKIDGAESGQKIEVKGSQAVITGRTTLYEDLKSKSWGGVKDIKNIPPELKTSQQLWKTLNLAELNPETPKGFGSKLARLMENIDSMGSGKSSSQKYDLTGIKFRVLFGALARAYFKTFDTMIILNTEDDLGQKSGESALLNTPIVIAESKFDNWYEDGIAILDDLYKQGINVTFSSAHDSGQGGFKAMYMGN